jgi:hypothetical protein
VDEGEGGHEHVPSSYSKAKHQAVRKGWSLGGVLGRYRRELKHRYRVVARMGRTLVGV